MTPGPVYNIESMRIVRIVTRMNIGGPSTHVALLTNRLDPARFSSCLVTGRPAAGEGDRRPWVEKGPARVIAMDCLQRPMHPWRDVLSFSRILRILWKEQPDLIHTHMAKAGFLGRTSGWLYNRIGPGRRSGRRAVLVHTFHGHVLEGYFPRWASALITRVERWLARRTDCLIAVSPAIRDVLIRKGVGRREQWRVVPLGLELSGLRDLAAPDGGEVLRCGLVGRLVPIKNPSLFLEALRRLNQNGARGRVEAKIFGDGPLRGGMEAQALKWGLGGRVSFAGWRQDPLSCYRELDVVCLTSWNEGTPLSLIEAMAAGRVVVASDVGGVRDLLGPVAERSPEIPAGGFQAAERGLLFRAGDSQGLAAALQALAEEPSLRRRIGDSGRAYVLKNFSHERLLGEISSLYTELNRFNRGNGT